MALDTYANLKTSLASTLNRSDLTPAIGDFVSLAEAQISRLLLAKGPVRRMQTRLAITVDDEFETVPTDFMGAQTIYLDEDGNVPLKFCTPDQLNELKRLSSDSGKPTHFTVVGGDIQFFPAPSEAYDGELTYWARVPALSDSNTTNWLLTLYPDAYLYGALVHSAPYLVDDARLTVWQTLFMTAINGIVEVDMIERQSTNMFVPYVPGGTP